MRDFIIVPLIVVIFSALSCGGGDNSPTPTPLSIQAYFTRLDQAWSEHRALLDSAPSSSPLDYKQIMEPILASLEVFTRELDAIRPPPEVSDAHRRLINALTESVDLERQGLDQYDPDATENPDATAGPEAVANNDALDQACSDLKAIAKRNSIQSAFFCLADNSRDATATARP